MILYYNTYTRMDRKIVKKTKIRCQICEGVGLVKSEVVLCDNCDGHKCMYCGESGYKSQPWTRCEVCYGDGELEQCEVCYEDGVLEQKEKKE